MIERELTFLAKTLPRKLSEIKPTKIIDIYIPGTAEHSHLRLRQKGEKFVITKKLPISENDISVQKEETIVLTESEFSALAKCSQKKVIKNRYSYQENNYCVEVDIFLEDLKGLVLIDFEFKTEAEKDSFLIPDYALANVTQEKFIAGGVLSGKKYEDLEENLKQFGYKKILEK